MTQQHASGAFTVKLTPQAEGEGGTAVPGRLVLDKQFSGDLEATGRGQMLAYRTSVEGSAGYVAIEQITGSLKGRSGSFVVQHSGTLTRGAASLSVTVVSDSGTGELTGIAGRMDIIIEGGKHAYTFDYTLGE